MSKVKRNCNGCKALIENSRFSCYCKFGVPIISNNKVYDLTVEYKPLEPCSKPKTYAELVRLDLDKETRVEL